VSFSRIQLSISVLPEQILCKLWSLHLSLFRIHRYFQDPWRKRSIEVFCIQKISNKTATDVPQDDHNIYVSRLPQISFD
jgi:hypothetical protein